jgi:flagellar biosynthesis protein FlhF
MRIKLIQAPNMAEAMRRVRTELGEDALILGHRRIANGVEITAALEPALENAPTWPRPERAAKPAAPQPAAPKADPHTVWLNSMMQRALVLPYGPLDWSKPVMLIGTPGAGKTLTAAKLATRLVQQGEAPMVITADSDRAGATEQLAAFTRILELDLIVSENPLMMARVLASRPARQKAIIDMAGCNPYDAAQIEALVTHAVTADANLVWVLPAGLDAEDAAELAQAFSALGARHVIPTKLDLTRRLESVLRAVEAGSFILTDAGIGAGVIDGIIPLEARDLVSRINDAASHLKKRQVA